MSKESSSIEECIDSHLHLDMSAFDHDRDNVIARGLDAGVVQMITIGCGLASSLRAIELAHEYPFIFATVGVHPHDAASANAEELEGIEKLLSEPKVVGIGEVGLDYHYMNSPKEAQQEIFRYFIRLALQSGYPLIIHSRDAEEDTLRILEEERQNQQIKGVIHCFNGSQNFAEKCLEMGFYLSVPGIITFSKALKKIIKKVPLSKLLIETDAPYLAPKPHRGNRNEPAYVTETGHKLAKILDVSSSELFKETTNNTRHLFGLPSVS